MYGFLCQLWDSGAGCPWANRFPSLGLSVLTSKVGMEGKLHSNSGHLEFSMPLLGSSSQKLLCGTPPLCAQVPRKGHGSHSYLVGEGVCPSPRLRVSSVARMPPPPLPPALTQIGCNEDVQVIQLLCKQRTKGVIMNIGPWLLLSWPCRTSSQTDSPPG